MIGKLHNIKEVNLKKVEKKSPSNEFYQEYKDKTEADFLKYNEDKLKSLSDECYFAMSSTMDGTLKMQLQTILGRIASAAKRKGMSVDERGVVEHEIPIVSSTQSGEEEWKKRVQEVEENNQEIEQGEQLAEEGPVSNAPVYQQPKRTSAETGRSRLR